MKERIKTLLAELVSIPSPTGSEEAIQSRIEALLRDAGFTTRRQEVAPSRFNLIARRGQSPLLLCTHVDTLPASDYALREEPPYLLGRGVVDAKGQIAALLAAVEGSSTPVSIALTVDEEDKGLGSRALELPPQVRYAVVLEPTGLRIAVAQVGAIEVEVTAHGREAHGACPAQGENAILRLVDLLKRIESAPSLQTRHPLFEPPYVTPYWFRGGHPELYLIPAEAKARLDIKLVPPLEPDAVFRELKGMMPPWAELTLLDGDPPFTTPEDAEVVRMLRSACEEAMGTAPPLVGMPSWTDAEPLHHKGVETVIFGAGELHLSHTAGERVTLDELVKLARILQALLRIAARRG